MRLLVNLLICVGMLVVVPTGLALLGDPAARLAGRYWIYVAAAGAISLWLPRGAAATALAIPYAAGAALLAGYALLTRYSLVRAHALGRTKRPHGRHPTGEPPREQAGKHLGEQVGEQRARHGWPAEAAALTALLSPAIAASALVAERSGHHLFGFGLGVLLLTVAHFHFAGFAAALIAGLQSRLRPGRRAALAALTVPTGTLIVLIGYFTSDSVELAGAVVLTAGMWTTGWLTWRYARTNAPDRLTAALLGTSAVVLAASMVLAVVWALGEATGIAHPSLTWMAATHGVANALGFAVCGLAGWRRFDWPLLTGNRRQLHRDPAMLRR